MLSEKLCLFPATVQQHIYRKFSLWDTEHFFSLDKTLDFITG